MNRKEKIAYARRYADDLVARHEGVVGIVLGGSVARGNDLPISDVDLWCFVDSRHHPLPIKKHSEGNLYVDIEQRPASELVTTDVAEDSYFCGYVHDAIILYDRDGNVGICQKKAREYLSSPSHRERQLASVQESVERNRVNLAASAEAKNAREACRTSIFAAWSMADYMLVAKGISPGGARGIARLANAWPEAASALIEFEGIADLDDSHIETLVGTYKGVADKGSFFQMWFHKVEWMLANGHRPDALHALWIALGLRIKDAKSRDIGVSADSLERACLQWLDTINWNWDTVRRKVVELEKLTDRFCA